MTYQIIVWKGVIALNGGTSRFVRMTTMKVVETRKATRSL